MNSWSLLFNTRLIIIAALQIFMYIENNLYGMGLTRVKLAVPRYCGIYDILHTYLCPMYTHNSDKGQPKTS